MKKTNKSPDSGEVTPSKKKLKQATLPFVVSNDVSPKPDVPLSRKRKLSVPDPEPVTKVGKITKEDNITEDPVVIIDDDSKGVSSPKKEDKQLNPYVKLVYNARKKKLQKTKGTKRGKTRSSKKQENKEDNQNGPLDDVEMVEVDVIIHEENQRDEKNSSKPSDEDVSSNNKVKNKDNSNTQETPERKTSSQVQSVENDSKKSTQNTVDSINKTEEASEIICLEDSNNSSDVHLSKNNEEAKLNYSGIKDISKTTPNNKKKSTAKGKQITPKRSTRIKTKENSSQSSKITSHIVTKAATKENEDQDVSEKEDAIKSKTSISNSKKTKTDNVENDSKKSDDSDVEMTEVIENNKSAESGNVSPISEKSDPENSSEENAVQSDSEEKQSPKRITRNKTLDESNLDVSTSSKLDESISSPPSTPKLNKSMTESNQGDKSLNESVKSANLTPKQLQKKLESAKKKEEREKEKLEREKKRQQEKEERAKQRQEKEDQKKREREEKEEAKRKEKEEKEELRRKEREEKEKLKEMEKKAREMKEEQKRKEKEDKEEQRKKEKEAREEEKRKRQEALELEKQEQELKKKKAAEAFVNFFVPKQKVDRESSLGPVSKNTMLSSFTIKGDMRLAPTCRTDLSTEKREALDKSLEDQNEEKLYLKCLKEGVNKPMSCGKTWPLNDKDDDVMIVEDELPPIDGAGEVITCESAPREKLRPKLLSFHENRRPPYWGTWRKKSVFVKPRKPFGQEKQLDYEVDSDDDWEDEQDGESLDGSAGGSEDEGADDYEVDNEVFVPHGYLSDEEATMDEDDVLSLSPETQKMRLKHLEDEFESELKKPTEKLKPRLYGLLWENNEGGKPDNCVDALWNYFEKFAMVLNDPTPLLQPAVESEETEKKKIKKKKVLAEVNEQSPKSEKKKKKTENKEVKKPKTEVKKVVPNQPGINSFLTKVKNT